jgi:DNA-binding transcriptional MerR regulator
VQVNESLMTIGAFARRSRLSMKALRLYARQGLLAPVYVDKANGYRWYRRSQLATAQLIAMLRRLDMPLGQVAEVVAAAGPEGAEIGMLRQLDRSLVRERGRGASAPRAAERGARPEAAAMLADYWERVERRVASQRQLAAHLRIRLLGEEGSLFPMLEVKQREVPEQLVLTEQRHVLVPDLSPWLGEAIGRLAGTAGRFGGVAAPVFVIYHGEVNQDSDGPVEVCVPIGLQNGPSTEVPMRREGAHREAYVRITKAQVEYPQILSAFDAVSQWLESNGVSSSGPPREIYFTDFMSAQPTDEVCDVAFPID